MEASLFPSHASLLQMARAPMVAALNRSLAPAIELYLQVKQAHWHIEEPQLSHCALLSELGLQSLENHINL